MGWLQKKGLRGSLNELGKERVKYKDKSSNCKLLI